MNSISSKKLAQTTKPFGRLPTLLAGVLYNAYGSKSSVSSPKGYAVLIDSSLSRHERSDGFFVTRRGEIWWK